MRVETPEGVLPPAFERVLGGKTGIVRSLSQTLLARDAPDVCLVIAEGTGWETLFDGDCDLDHEIPGGGPDFGTASERSLREMIARYCACWPPDSDRLNDATYEELVAEEEVVDFEYLDVYDRDAVGSETDLSRTTKLQWVAGTDLRTDEEVYVPASCVWQRTTDGANDAFGTRNGSATGLTAEAAILDAVYDAVKRDAFVRSLLTERSPTELRLPEGHPANRFRHRNLERGSVETHLLEYDTEFDISVVGCVLVDEGHCDADLAVSVAASASRLEAATEALLEVVRERAYRENRSRRDDGASVPAEVTDFARCVRGDDLTASDWVATLLDGPTERIEASCDSPAKVDEPKNVDDRLAHCLRELADRGYTPIAVDVTTDDVRSLGAHVTRVFVPELVPLTPPSVLPIGHPAFDGTPTRRDS